MSELLGNHPIRTSLLIFGGFTAFVGAARYNKAHEDVTPIRMPEGSAMVAYPRHDMLQVRIPVDEVESFDCGSQQTPIPLLGESVDNPKAVIAETGTQAVVQCDMAADVPIIDADGQRIG